MRHQIPVDQLGPQGPAMAQAVQACVHCGFCLATCPTYLDLGEEMDSPRGRILLMKEALEGELPWSEVQEYVDRCLGCLACVSACPSGVQYGELLMPFRGLAAERRRRGLWERVVRGLVYQVLPFAGRFRLAARGGALARPLAFALPEPLPTMLRLLPEQVAPAQDWPTVVPAQGVHRARVALLTGCVQSVLAPQINRATVAVLARNGVEVLIPPGQGCCGALSMHGGELAQARALARRNLDCFPLDQVDAVVTNAAGCGSGMHEYPLLFAGTEDEARARQFAAKVQDVSRFLDRLGIEPPGPLPRPVTAAYHDACHLAHAQGVREEPRRLLGAIPNLRLVSVPEGEICCGSAGTYNLEHPDIAARLGTRKAAAIRSTGAEVVITGNIGCMTQIRAHLAAQGVDIPVRHTMEILAEAYGVSVD